jgi:arabinofuranan 3-O-arabinosyltransferase
MCVLMTGVAFVQSPGTLVPDTKLDLVVAPWEFLERATHLWDSEGSFGQLQNQGYGYLWPMGPFFGLGAMIDLPGWVVQRFWTSLVLCAAFVGSARLARALGVRSDLACIVGGAAFALSPRMLSVIGPSSVEVWPSALAPWVLLPLVIGARQGSPRRAACLSAVAVAMVGGVNAAATAAVLPLGAVWLLTRERGPRRRAMMLWWPIFTLVATAWWLVPLLLLGSYSPPFLDYIETAGNTTFPATIFDALRGTSNWVPYVTTSSRAGNDLLRQYHLILNSGVVLAAGLIGMLLRRNPHRVFLIWGTLVGLVLVTMGHQGAVRGGFADQLHTWLDGPLAPLRNTHKFDPVVRLPLVMGLAWTLETLVRLAREASRERRGEALNNRILVGIVSMAVVVTTTPIMMGRLTPDGAFNGVPDYWRQTATWLGQEQDRGVALLLPGSAFGTYVWGAPGDEPMQALATKPWAVRSGVPLTPPGTIRMMDAIQRRIDQGSGGSGLAEYLRRAGVSHVVVRNDLVRSAGIVDPVLVHQALQATPGLRPVATFGPVVGGQAVFLGDRARALVNGGWQNEYAAIEVYELDQDVTPTAVSSSPPVVVGGPEDLLDLAELEVLGDEPTQLAADLGDDSAAGRDIVLTDGLRAVDRSFGQVTDASSSVRTRAEVDGGAGQRDYTLGDPRRWSSVADYRGIESVTASDSLSEPRDASQPEPGAMPYAALDGHLETAWTSSRFAEQHWWQVDFEEPTDLSGNVVLVAGPGADQRVIVRTSSFESQAIDLVPGERVEVAVGDTAADWLRVEDVSGRTATSVRLSEVEIPGVQAQRTLVLPLLPDGSEDPTAIVLRAMDDLRTGCALIDGDTRCVPRRVGNPEEPLGFDRTFALPSAEEYQPRVTARARAGDGLLRQVLAGSLTDVEASSVGNPDMRASALAAVDGSTSTTWSAAEDDKRPRLRVGWLGKQTIRAISVTVDPEVAARQPRSVTLTWPGGRRVVNVGKDGLASLSPIRTDQLTITVDSAETTSSIGFDGAASPVPVGITELSLRGAAGLPLTASTEETELPCGSGPDLVVNGVPHRTRVTASPAAMMTQADLTATLCGGSALALPSGESVVSLAASELFTPRSLVLSRGSLASQAVPVGSSAPDATHRAYEAPTGHSLLSTTENVNRGWRASRDGHALVPVTLDGWRQGYRLDVDGSGEVRARFGPDLPYRVALGLGLLSTILLAAGCVVSARRKPRSRVAPLEASRPGLALSGAVALTSGWLLAGSVGALLGAGAIAVVVLVARRAPMTFGAVLIACLMTATGAYVVRPWGSSAGWAGDLAWPSYLVLVSLAAAAVWSGLDGRSSRVFRFMAGRSTKR